MHPGRIEIRGGLSQFKWKEEEGTGASRKNTKSSRLVQRCCKVPSGYKVAKRASVEEFKMKKFWVGRARSRLIVNLSEGDWCCIYLQDDGVKSTCIAIAFVLV